MRKNVCQFRTTPLFNIIPNYYNRKKYSLTKVCIQTKKLKIVIQKKLKQKIKNTALTYYHI